MHQDHSWASHNYLLVVLAVSIAVLASYTALSVSARAAPAPSRKTSFFWIGVAAVCMGGGIWAMHFVAMLSLDIPGLTLTFEPVLTAVSLIVAILLTGLAFATVFSISAPRMRYALGGLLMGVGIVVMHYVGMAAILNGAPSSYNLVWVVVASLIALGASTAALVLAFGRGSAPPKFLSAIVMGLAISGMHFSGMQGVAFGLEDQLAETVSQTSRFALAAAVIGITLVILIAAVVAATFDQRFADLMAKEAEALRKSEEQFRRLYRRTPLPLHSLNGEGVIDDVSDSWLSLLGYHREEAIGRPLTDFMTETSMQSRREDWRQLMAEGELRDREYRMVTKSGTILDVLCTSRVEAEPGSGRHRVVGGLVDVAARKQAEEALRQSQKMEAVGQLTGGIAHDFNNVLAIVLGSLELMQKRMAADDPLRHLVESAAEGARRGASLTQRMLAFARKQSLEPKPVRLQALVPGMLDLLTKSLDPQITLHVELGDDLPPIFADSNQLELAILNLVVNARDAMDKGRILLRAEPPTLDPATGAPGLVGLSVVDTGHGMDEATRSRILEPFFTTKEVGKGTGLGLSMVSGFVEQSGGRLDIDSAPGLGTTITLWFPQAPQETMPGEAVASAAGAAEAHSLAGTTVLIVDDEPLILLNAEAILLDAGLQVLIAHTAAEALAILEATPGVACVVTDYAMPGMTGGELAATLRQRLPAVPVIIATGFADMPAEADMHQRLDKPYSEEALLSTIASVLDTAAHGAAAKDSSAAAITTGWIEPTEEMPRRSPA